MLRTNVAMTLGTIPAKQGFFRCRWVGARGWETQIAKKKVKRKANIGNQICPTFHTAIFSHRQQPAAVCLVCRETMLLQVWEALIIPHGRMRKGIRLN